MERKEERVMARQSIFKFNERVTTEAKDATYEFRGPVISVRNLEKKFGEHEVLKDISFDLFEGDCGSCNHRIFRIRKIYLIKMHQSFGDTDERSDIISWLSIGEGCTDDQPFPFPGGNGVPAV